MSFKIIILGEKSYLRDQVELKLNKINGIIIEDRLENLIAVRGLEPSLILIASPTPRVWLEHLQAQLLEWEPIMVISDSITPILTAQWYELGAYDVTPIHIPKEELTVRLRTVERKANQLQAAAFQDPLTGIYNRRFVSEFLSGRMASRLEMRPVSVILLDIDYFKNINDTYGHQTGDEVLRTFAEVLRKNVRKGDWVIRYGGEEFLLLLPNTAAEEAKMTMNSVSMLVSAIDFNNAGITITFSSGIAEWKADHSLHTIIGNADRALYKAKKAGRCLNIIDTLELEEMERVLFVGPENNSIFPSSHKTYVRDETEAQHALSKSAYDIIVIDMDANHSGSGFEWISKIRSTLSMTNRHPKTSMVAASVHRGTAERYLSMGADDFLLLS